MSDRPLDPVVDAVMTEAVYPLIDRIEKDLGLKLVTDVSFLLDGVQGPRIRIGEKDTSGEADGELRVKVRETFGADRFVYSIESVYKRDLTDSGFSGFVAKGEIRVSAEGAPKVIPKSWTVRYHVWTFCD